MSGKSPQERLEEALRRADEAIERWKEIKDDLKWKLGALSAWAESRKKDKDGR